MATTFKNKCGLPVQFEGMVDAKQPTDVLVYNNDFFQYAAGDWTLTTTEAGGSDATEAIVADGSLGGGGVLKITNDAGADDCDQLQGPEIVKLESGKPLFFRTRVLIDDTGLAEWFIGLSITDTTMKASGDLTMSDYIGFVGGPTDVAADKILFRACKNSTETDGAQFTIADATWYKLAFYWDGYSTVRAYMDDVEIGALTTNIPDDEYLAVSLVINNSTAASRYMALDYIQVLAKR